MCVHMRERRKEGKGEGNGGGGIREMCFLLYFQFNKEHFCYISDYQFAPFRKAQKCFLKPFLKLPVKNSLFVKLQLLTILRNGFLYLIHQHIPINFSPGNWYPCLGSSRFNEPTVCSNYNSQKIWKCCSILMSKYFFKIFFLNLYFCLCKRIGV